LVLQGRVNDVRELLAQHPDKQAGEYDVSTAFENLKSLKLTSKLLLLKVSLDWH